MRVNILATLTITVLLSAVSCQRATPTSISGFGRAIEGANFDAVGNFFAVAYDPVGFPRGRPTIGRVFPDGAAEAYFTMPGPEMTKFNGLRSDFSGTLYATDMENKRVVKIHPSNQHQVICQSSRMEKDTPNDLALSQSGVIYLSGQNFPAAVGQIWICRNGEAELFETLGRTNGIALSPGDSTLYVTEGVGPNNDVNYRILAYDVAANGDLSNKRIFFEFQDKGIDGMRCDADGNLYVTRRDLGKVDRITPLGVLDMSIALSFPQPTNLDFGGPDGKTLYIVGRCADNSGGCVDSFRVPVRGKTFAQWHPNDDGTLAMFPAAFFFASGNAMDRNS